MRLLYEASLALETRGQVPEKYVMTSGGKLTLKQLMHLVVCCC